MISAMKTRQASYSENLDLTWLAQQTGKENIILIRKTSKYVHLRRRPRAKSVIVQADKYRLNYVEVEIGPPRRREGSERGPAIKVSNGNSNRVNYSTIIFPDRTPGSTANGARLGPQIVSHPILPASAPSGGKAPVCYPSRTGAFVTSVGECRVNPGNHTKLERKGSRITEAQQQQQLDVPKTPPGSPPRRRALSTPTRSRKFPSESEIADAIKSQKDKEHGAPKTRTLPPGEKPWSTDSMEQELTTAEMVAKRAAELRKEGQTESLHSVDNLSNSAPSYKLSSAMQAMRMKVRRKSSLGDSYEIVNIPSELAKEAGVDSGREPEQQPVELSTVATESPPTAHSHLDAANVLRSSPVMKRHRTELEKAFARRKLTGRISGELENYMSHSGSMQSSSGECSPQEGIPGQFSDISAIAGKYVPVLPIIKSNRERGMPDGQRSLSIDYKHPEPPAHHASPTTRKPIPTPRFGQQSRESSLESINDPVYLNQRPMPSPPLHSQPDGTATANETYMNVAFCKTKQDTSHRYENVILDERSVSLDHGSNASDSPRDSLELHSNRPVPAPRMHSSNSSIGSDHTSHHYSTSSSHQKGSCSSGGSTRLHHSKHHGHTRQDSYGSTAALLSHINAASMMPIQPGNTTPIKSKFSSSDVNALYATPCKIGSTTTGSFISHGQTAVKATHSIATPDVTPISKPDIPAHHHRRDSHGSTGSHSGRAVSDAEKSSSIDKAIGQMMKDGEKRSRGERRHREKAHGDKKSREERKEERKGERKGHHGEKRSHGRRHRGDGGGSGSSGSGSKSKSERPSYGNQPWYYGRMLRQECEYLMLSQGQSCQYLVRDSSHRTGDLMLSVLYGQKVHHYVIQTTPNNKFHIAHHDFSTVEDILDFYHHHVIMYSPNKEPVYLTEPFILQHK